MKSKYSTHASTTKEETWLNGGPHVANTHVFSKEEELSNSITHGIGMILSVAALVILIVFASHCMATLGILSVLQYFGATMLLLYTSSTLLHAFRPGRAKDFF